VLQHAPYAFKTLTNSTGALAYIYSNFNFGLSGQAGLPWLNGTTGCQVTHIVIHCLPGLYGPSAIPGLSDNDAEAGLPFNGETWPALIRDTVSLQGTSALDTIFDGRLQDTRIIEVNEFINSGISHDESFIDSLTVRRARRATLTRGNGAGIYVHSRRPDALTPANSYITISNCFITDNVVGIGVDSFVRTEPSTSAAQRIRVVNNTIAWNACGIWSGRLADGFPANELHINEMAILNTIFDSGSPASTIAGLSCFEGISAGEKQVYSRNGVPIDPTVGWPGQDFNAWEVGRVNLNIAIAPNWPMTLPNNLTVTFTPPRVDIAPYAWSAGGRRGSLYLNDIMRRAPALGNGSEYSSNDFRLSPSVSRTAAAPGDTTVELNPLVNRGIDDVTTVGGSAYPLVFRNGRTIPYAPGLPPMTEEARIDAWDWDGEGYGNGRIRSRVSFATGTFGSPVQEALIDIGADEMGELIMGGFLGGTRIYTNPGAVGSPPVADHGRVLFFDLIAPNASYPRPVSNAIVGQIHYWWNHVTQGLDVVAGTNYTNAPVPVGTERWQLLLPLPSGPGYPTIMRSLECDFGGHLLPDAHPYWGVLHDLQPPLYPDIYAGSPWHEGLPVWPFMGVRDNPSLFHNLGGSPHNGTSGWFGYFWTGVVDGTLNPPNTYPLANGNYLLGLTYQFGPFNPCGGGSNYTVGNWGYGDTAAGCPDRPPYFSQYDSLGIRYNCQRPGTAQTPSSNLQTFLAIIGENQQALRSSRVTAGYSLPARATVEEVRRAIKDATARLSSRR
jgi:hypothetical protein